MTVVEMVDNIRKSLNAKPLVDDPAIRLDFINAMIRLRVAEINALEAELVELRAMKGELIEQLGL